MKMILNKLTDPWFVLMLLPALVALLLLAGCGTNPHNGRPLVVATTTQVADLASNVAGNKVDVVQLMPANADPHEYEPTPQQVAQIARAKVVFISGLGLDSWIYKVVASSGAKVSIIDLSAKAPIKLGSLNAGSSAPDPHWWHNPQNAKAASNVITTALENAFPKDKVFFEDQGRRYANQLSALDSGINRCLSGIPAGQRKLVTNHAAFQYFAKRYKITVIGTVIPSTSTAAEPSAGEINALVARVRAQKVPAVFSESSVNSKLVDALATEAGAKVGGSLYGDTLGPKGSSGDTYIKSMQSDARTIARGLIKGKRTCNF